MKNGNFEGGQDYFQKNWNLLFIYVITKYINMIFIFILLLTDTTDINLWRGETKAFRRFE